MYADNTLTPKEAIRLCALGTLATAPMRYDELATAIRHFVSRLTGPSLDLMGESIELLRYEGLIEPVATSASNDDGDDEALLQVTAEGNAAVAELLLANIRVGGGPLNELILALKVRFIHLLPPADQLIQIDTLVESCETELARLEDLRRHYVDEAGYLEEWLVHDLTKLEDRQSWLEGLRIRLQVEDSSAAR